MPLWRNDEYEENWETFNPFCEAVSRRRLIQWSWRTTLPDGQLYFLSALSSNRLEWSVCSACHLPTFMSSDLIKQMLFRRRSNAISRGQSVRTHSHPTKHLDVRRFARLCKRSARILLYCMSSLRVVAVSFLSRNALHTSAVPFVRHRPWARPGSRGE